LTPPTKEQQCKGSYQYSHCDNKQRRPKPEKRGSGFAEIDMDRNRVGKRKEHRATERRDSKHDQDAKNQDHAH